MVFRKIIETGKIKNVVGINKFIPARNIRTKHGIIYPEPKRVSFGILRVILTIASGLFIGAAISKNIANFLEENDLFVPSDDDDDDD